MDLLVRHRKMGDRVEGRRLNQPLSASGLLGRRLGLVWPAAAIVSRLLRGTQRRRDAAS